MKEVYIPGRSLVVGILGKVLYYKLMATKPRMKTCEEICGKSKTLKLECSAQYSLSLWHIR